ncbi:MAG: FAD-dependent oxidoreductase [Alphaproteobacteria bacterium]|nr:FAD-dependent oxidoreductase [Alphaproteobacteria bacterium]
MGETGHIVVIGAGIVGTATACYLRRDGHEVTLIDPEPPGTMTSFGNAGAISSHACLPQTGPGLLLNAPHWLLDPLGPLFIRWRHLPEFLPWLIRFIQAGRPEPMRRQMDAMAALHRLALEAHLDLAAEAGITGLIRQNGTLTVYESTDSFRTAAAGRDSQRQRGFEVEELSGDELRQLEPGLAPIFPHAAFFPGGAHSIDPGALAAGLATAFIRGSGRVLAARVAGFDFDDNRPVAARTEAGAVAADGFVIAAGAWSAGLAEMLGEKVVLESERGYHLTLADPGIEIRRPISFHDRKFMATPMEMGLRLAGTAEFAGLEAPPNWKRIEPLRAHARKAFRGIHAEEGSCWMGNRPATPDSLPVLGASQLHRNVWYGFGHGHLGLTAGPISGRHIADLAAGRPPAIDLAPYRIDRF